ncbi:MAG: transcriptional repressor LexA [Candidatus Omnitrophica bacterium]|nr:transcriptional repressor LexA [Candidatus Omnitrophota bacterium]MDD5671123.1 transcriptional repressor LexA [Candidatus Omnitrophota bacterium]
MARTLDLGPILSKLRGFYAKRKRLPSFSEIQALAGYSSKGGVSVLVRHLIKKGIVKKDSAGKLLPTPALSGGIKLLGVVQAGFPSPAEEELIDTLSLDEFLIQKPQSSYLVKVTGDSMIEAGIMAGDLVIVERGREPKSGDIVIAQVDGAWTMKYFEKQGGKVILRAANKKYSPIHPQAELVVGGVVVANVRKYR